MSRFNNADTADFAFFIEGADTGNPNLTHSIMAITDHDMRLQTLKTDSGVDADMNLVSAESIYMNAQTSIRLVSVTGEYLGYDIVPEKQIATIGDLPTTANDSWTVATGTATYSFTLPSSGTYVMWVEGNIPNGIISWNATVSVTNANVPAIGSQYAWNYTGGGSPILITAIPNQIRGVAGTINTDNTYVGSTSNRFDFTIANTSGASRTVYYGYTKI